MMLSVNSHFKYAKTAHAPYRWGARCTLTVREKIAISRMHVCPGCYSHDVPNRDKIFETYCGGKHKAYVMYWRSHVAEYKKYILKERA